LPSPGELEAARRAADWRAVALTDAGVALPTGAQLDLGGVLEGWLAARASAALTVRGFADHLVDAGGDLAIGGRRGERPWRVAIADPRGDGARLTIDAPPGEVATSGDYHRFVEIGGVRYGHIIDPRTGWPARGVASVTVIARRDTDPLATALFVLGVEPGLALAAALPGVEALFITTGGELRATRGLRVRGRHVEVLP
jgi:thiamine biosynthesis lipoprotein